ncbi:MAG: hypothetical protein HOE90_13150 [Bacteriovoracaceae bacterium]|jgi:hypothetical protein|nr:hypothetical protein [Bacteriovoracaceae bacterium]
MALVSITIPKSSQSRTSSKKPTKHFWGQTDPTNIADFDCFVILADWEGGGGNQCVNNAGSVVATAAVASQFITSGGTASLEVPIGENRVFYLLAFKATSLEYCPVSFSDIDAHIPNLSQPQIIGSASSTIEGGDNTVEIIASLSGAELIEDCSGGIFNYDGELCQLHTGMTSYNELGVGSSDDPYILCTADQINSISETPSAMNKKFLLADDIHMDDDGTNNDIPIGSSANPFTGTFVGNDHTIYDFSFNYAPTSNGAGFFGQVSGAGIYYLNLSNVDIFGNNEVGGLAGTAINSSIAYISLSGNVQANTTDVGGAIGKMSNGTQIAYTSTTVSVLGNQYAIGGLVGNSDTCHDTGGSSGGIFFNSVNATVATDSGGVDVYLGGLVGYALNTSISENYTSGTLDQNSQGGASLVGGLVAELETDATFPGSSYILNSYSEMSTSVLTDTWFGALAGKLLGTASDDSTLTKSYSGGYAALASGTGSNMAGLIGYCDYCVVNDNFVAVEIAQANGTSNNTDYTIAFSTGNDSVSNLYYASDVNCEANGGGVGTCTDNAGAISTAVLESTFMGNGTGQPMSIWNATIWKFTPGDYPRLINTP